MDHKTPELQLLDYLQDDKVSNSLLLSNLPTSRLHELAKLFAKTVLEKSGAAEASLLKFENNNHPDFHIAVPDLKVGQYSMDKLRAICQLSVHYPHEAPCQFFVLEGIDRLQEAGCNFLLKTLEEPENHSYFLLLAEDTDSILPTLLSRLQKLAFTESKEKDFCFEPLEKLLLRWPQFTYDDIASTCELIEKEAKERSSSWMGQQMLQQVDQWVQQQLMGDAHISLEHYESLRENAQTALERSMKLSTALEYLLLELNPKI